MKYEETFTFENLYKSYLKARKGKRWKNTTKKYEANALEYTYFLYYQLNTKTYTLGEYNEFYVYEPKKRLIKSLPFKDRVVQHCLCDYYLEDVLEPHFIYDNYASRKNKGTHKGLERLEEFLRRFYRKSNINGYVLKCDIAKYFNSIDHDVLKRLLKKKVDEDELMELIETIVDSTPGTRGIPIGNQTSQLFAIYYMSEFDHYVKEKLKIKYYIRYMDDFILIYEDKEYLKYCKNKIEEYLNEELKLELNKKTQIFPLKNGIDFLGFHTYITSTGKVVRKIRKDSKERMKRKLKKFKKLYDCERITKDKIDASYNSWKGHAKHGNSYHLIRDMDEKYNSIFKKEW